MNELGIEKEDILILVLEQALRTLINHSLDPFIVKMVDEDAANKWTNNGTYKTNFVLEGGKVVYLNPDLSKADRTANFSAGREWRKQRNHRTRQSSSAPI